MIASADIPYLPRGVRLHHDDIRDNWVLLAPERAVWLDQVGHAILSEIDGKRSFGDITETLSKKFNAPPDEVAKDSASFLGALLDRRFLELHS